MSAATAATALGWSSVLDACSRIGIEIPTEKISATDIFQRKDTRVVLGRYELGHTLGKGVQGKVKECRDLVTNERVAIKKIENAFEHVTFTKRTLRELRILRHLRHENLIDVRMDAL